jgi:hypothetical protein
VARKRSSRAASRTPAELTAVGGYTYGDRLGEVDLAADIGRRLTGTPADGSRPPSTAPPAKVVWTDAGDEVLVHLDSTKTRILDRLLYVSVDLECDQTGRSPLVCAFALGNADDPSGLLAVTDELPRGHGLLASRWGGILQDAIWGALLGLVGDYAAERRLAPIGISASPAALGLHAGEELIVQLPGTLAK